METTKKVWCVTDGLTQTINLYENRYFAKKTYARWIRYAKKNKGKIIYTTKVKGYFSTFMKTKKGTFYWVRCEVKYIR